MAKQKIKNYLHELIHSLSQTEKRYFKLLEKQQSPNKKSDYLLLFEAIEKQEVFDEQKIKQKFKGTNIEKRFASLKKYLYELILKSLAFYNHDNIASVRVRRMLDTAEVLQRKGLYHQAIRKLEKTEVAAEDAGMNFILHDIHRLKVSCMTMIGAVPDLEGFNLFKHQLEQLTERFGYTTTIFNTGLDLVYHSMYNHNLEGNIRKEEVKKILPKNYLEMEDELKDGYNKHLYYRSLKTYFSILDQPKELYKYTLKHIEVFESGALKIKNYPSNYIHSIMDVISYLNLSDWKEEIDEWVEKAKSFFDNNNYSYYNKGNDYGHLLCLEFTNLIRLNKMEAMKEKALEVEGYLEEKSGQMNSFAKRWLVYNLAWTYLLSGAPKTALKWSNELINNLEVKSSFYLNSASIIQNVIIHFELKNFNYLDFAVNSFYNELVKKYKLNEMENKIFDFLIKNMNKIGSSDISNRKLFNELFESIAEPESSSFDFVKEFPKKWLNIKAGHLKLEKSLLVKTA